MKNSETLNTLIKKYLEINPQYSNEIGNFDKFLTDRELKERIFNLSEHHIDEYFIYSYKNKIGAIPTLVSHISALKSFMSFLDTENHNFKPLLGYIATPDFQNKLKSKLEKSIEKQVINFDLLRIILTKLDNHLDSNIEKSYSNTLEKNRFLEKLIARIFIKISLIIPLKPTGITQLNISNEVIENRSIVHNGLCIKLPSTLVRNIEQTIAFIEREYGDQYENNEMLFGRLYSCLGKVASTSTISNSLTLMYKELGLSEMLVQTMVGKKNMYNYPSESYKKTAIFEMLNNGVNIMYLKKLTGLDLNSLINDYDFSDEQKFISEESYNVNSSLINSNYYSFL